MKQFILALGISPVHDFIAASRRTADLRAGSALLVEVARVAAQTVQKYGRLIFPADLEADIPNKILAIIETDRPDEVAREAEEAARNHLLSVWEDARMEGLGENGHRYINAQLARGQIEGFLECYAAWSEVANGGYKTARREAERLLAGRKALRDFTQPIDNFHQPKSPLDPSRPTIIQTQNFLVPKRLQRGPFWLNPRETLDAMSLLKRLRNDAGFPSTPELAAASALPLMHQRAPEAVTRLETIARESGVFDIGSLLLREYDDTELMLSGIDPKEIGSLQYTLRDAVKPWQLSSSFAVLNADGDRMGRLIDAKSTIDDHLALSAALSQFAGGVPSLVEAWGGHAIYSGGDDVLAFLPVNSAIDCAAALAEAFKEALKPVSNGGHAPSLSVGVAIVHFLNPLMSSIEYGRTAESVAKETRNALAISYHPRGGEVRTFRMSWGDSPQKAAEEWRFWVDVFRNRDQKGSRQAYVARSLPYEWEQLAREFHGLDLSPQRLRAEALRIAARKIEGGKDVNAKIKLDTITDKLQQINHAEDLRSLANQLIIARYLASFPGWINHG